MIEKWEIVSDPNERFPNRDRVNVSAQEDDLKPLLNRFSEKMGKPWKRSVGPFNLSFYLYDLTGEERAAVEAFLSQKGAVVLASPAPDARTPAPEPPSELRPGPAAHRPPPPVPERERPASPALGSDHGAPETKPSGEGAGLEDGRLVLGPPEETSGVKGRRVVRLGYVVPASMVSAGDQIHRVLEQTLESQSLPFALHKTFFFFYPILDADTVDDVVAAAEKHRVDMLISVGENARIQPLLDRCQEKRVPCHFLSRDDVDKKYWRFGLVTRVVLRE
jgi:hypothetical protein